MVGGLVLGAALGGPLPHVEATLLSALTGAIVAAAGSTGPSRIARRLAVVAAGSSLVLMVVAFATGNHAVWAALAMAAVALVTSLAAGIGPLGAVLGYLLSLAYLLVAGLSRGRSRRGRLAALGRGAHRRGLRRRPDRRLRRDVLAQAE